MGLRRAFKQLSAAEALHALYIDFEGRKKEAPVLVGVMHRPGRGATPFVQQDVLDKAFAGLSGSWLPLHKAVEKVVMRAEKHGIRIVSWSEHDLKVVQAMQVEHPGLVARFEARYANARAVAARWRTMCHPGTKPHRGSLTAYQAIIGYPVPEEAAPGHVGDTIRLLRPRLERGLLPTPAQRLRWARLVEHNRRDCHGMKRVCLIATRDLEAVAQ